MCETVTFILNFDNIIGMALGIFLSEIKTKGRYGVA